MKKRDLIYAALPAFMLAACTSTGILRPLQNSPKSPKFPPRDLCKIPQNPLNSHQDI